METEYILVIMDNSIKDSLKTEKCTGLAQWNSQMEVNIWENGKTVRGTAKGYLLQKIDVNTLVATQKG